MNRNGLSDTVMERVVRYETGRTWTWVLRFAAIIVLLCAGVGFAAWYVVADLRDQGAGDMFAIVSEDSEILFEYAGDIMETVWLSVPRGYVYAGAVLMLLLVGYLVATAGRRRIVARRLRELAKYTVAGQNEGSTPRRSVSVRTEKPHRQKGSLS